MKKTALLFSLCISALAANAQLALSGSAYTQSFNSLSAGLPSGWNGYVSATSTSLGTVYVDPTGTFGSSSFGVYNNASGTDTLAAGCPSSVFGAGFKNCASADAGGGTTAMTCAEQQAVTNRAFGVRQKGTGGYDPGPAFTLELANTSGLTNFHLTFNLQSLDTTCPRVTVWTVDYGTGATPSSFTTVTTAPATLTTGGYTFANTPVTVNFGSALDNSSSPVWIRITSLAATTNTLGGNGSRATSAIDDVNLTWTGTAHPVSVTNLTTQPGLALTVLGNATSDKVNFAYTAEEAGNYNLRIYDLTGRIVYTQNVNAQSGNQTISVDGLNLAPAMYIAKMSNGNASSVARIAVQ